MGFLFLLAGKKQKRAKRMKLLRHISGLAKLTRRIRGCMFRMLVLAAGGKCLGGLHIERGFRLRHGCHSGLVFGKNFYLGKDITIDCPFGAKLTIGDDVTLTQGVFISAAKHVEIGSQVLVGEYVSLRDSNHSFDDLSTPIRDQPMRSGTLKIGDNCWIGRGACLLPGTNLGSGVVVGANSVVNRLFGEDSVIIGSPASLSRKRGLPIV
jgi:acetyltransferase-like isoleucine patch superfamily enzyme